MLAASVDDEQVGSVTNSLSHCGLHCFLYGGKGGKGGFEFLGHSLTRSVSKQAESELAEVKSQVKMIFRRMSRSSAPEASIESGQYNLQ